MRNNTSLQNTDKISINFCVSPRDDHGVTFFFRRPIFPRCHICSLQHCRDGSAELGDFLRASPFASHNRRYLILSEFIAFVTHVALNANTLVSIPPRFHHRTCRLLPPSAHSVLHQLPHLLTRIPFPSRSFTTSLLIHFFFKPSPAASLNANTTVLLGQ